MEKSEQLAKSLDELLGEQEKLPESKISLNPKTGRPDYAQYFKERDDDTGAIRLLRLQKEVGQRKVVEN